MTSLSIIGEVQVVILLLIINVYVYTAVSAIGWWNRHKPGIWYFIFGTICVIIFSLIDIITIMARSATLIHTVQIISTGLAPAAGTSWTLFVLGYLGYLDTVSDNKQVVTMTGVVAGPLFLAALPGLYVEPAVQRIMGTVVSAPSYDAVGSTILLSTLLIILLGILILLRGALIQRLVSAQTTALLIIPGIVFLAAGTVSFTNIIPPTLPLPRLVGPFAALAYVLFFSSADGLSVLPATSQIGVQRAFQQLSVGVVVVEDERVILCNESAASHLGMGNHRSIRGTQFDSFLNDIFDRTPINFPATFEQEERTYEITRTQIHASGSTLLIHDVTDRRERRELKRQNEQFERLGKVIAHDFQTPLSTAQKLTRLLRLKDTDSNQDIAQILDDLDAVHQRLEEFADHLPALARNGIVVGDPVECELAEVAESAWAVIETGPLELEILSSRTLVGDPKRLKQAFQNLFENVVTHGVEIPQRDDAAVSPRSEGATDSEILTDGQSAVAQVVEIGCFEGGFYIADDGPGFSDTNTETADIFEYGMSTSGSAGLGLALVRTVFEAHGWDVRATESEYGGARFDIELESPDEA
jgi:signal transduction histidine kinase